MSNVHMVLMRKDMDPLEKQQMMEEIEQVDGVKWRLNMNSLIGPAVPGDVIP